MPIVTVAIDTEEDNWGAYVEHGATSRNIDYLPELQDRMARWGARPTYLVNRAPLLESNSTAILGELAANPGVEIGAHCHPWNTPPSTGEGVELSMMYRLPTDANRAKIHNVRCQLEEKLGVQPRSFRAGRWGFGPTVSEALSEEGFLVDVSVSPFIDWTQDGGPDYSDAQNRPYRFDPARPFERDPQGSMVEIPTTVGFLKGDHRRGNRIRRAIEHSPLRRAKVIGLLDKSGLLRRRWLSPETATANDMIRLVEACLRSQEPVVGLTFHSCALMPGATPFVRTLDDHKRFVNSIEAVLKFCSECALTFKTLSEVGQAVAAGTLSSAP